MRCDARCDGRRRAGITCDWWHRGSLSNPHPFMAAAVSCDSVGRLGLALTIAVLFRGRRVGRCLGPEAREALGLVIRGAHVNDDRGLRLDVRMTERDIEQGAVMMQAPALEIRAHVFERFVRE